PVVNVYVPSRVESVVLASDPPLLADLTQWDALMAPSSVQESLAEVGLGAPEELLGTVVLDDAGVRRYVGDAAPVTDDLPALEFFRPHPGRPFSLVAMSSIA